MRISFALFTLLALAACEKDHSPLVTITNELGNITIRNQSPVTVYYAAFERESLSQINWAPFCGESNRIQGFSTLAILVTDSSFTPSNEAAVFWWSDCVKRSGSEYLTGQNLRSVIIRVR